MNTDEILDFVVEYYIWFIIGGAIIVVALIGFFAEKKKALPSQKKKNKNEIEEIVISKEEMTVNNNDIDRLNEDMQNDQSINQNEQINISAMDDRTVDKNNFEEAPSENNTENEEDNNTIIDTTIKEPSVESIALEETNNNAEKTKTNSEDIQYSLEENKQDFEDEKLTNPIFENNMETLVKDIKTIDKMEFSNDNNKKESFEEPIKDEFREKLENEISDEVKEEPEEEVKEKTITEKKLNENLDDTMQISYSQLKEMVEDIIAENQKENLAAVNKEHNVEETVETNLPEKNSGIVDMPLPNLENITVDSISKQDDDEDDVWKF